MAIEIERVVVTDEVLTPYFWISGVPPSNFEAAAAENPTIHNVRKLDEFRESALYRAEWTAQVQSVLYVYTEIEAVILEATGTDSGGNSAFASTSATSSPSSMSTARRIGSRSPSSNSQTSPSPRPAASTG